MSRKSDEDRIRDAVNLLKSKDYRVMLPKRTTCVYHQTGHKTDLALENFYANSPSSIWRGEPFGKIPICKDCINNIYTNYFTMSQHIKWSMYKLCQRLDVPFLDSIYEGALKENKGDWQGLYGYYMKTYNSLKSKNGWDYNFDNSEKVEIDFDETGIIEIKESEVKWKNDDKRNKRDVISKIGYEIYENYPDADQKSLYNDIVNYLDDDTLKDQYKISVIINIVDNNNQIRKYQYRKNLLSADPNTAMKQMANIKSLDTSIKTLTDINKILANDNGISLINRKDGTMDKSLLTVRMKFLAEQNFDDVEIDYYDQMKCYGMQRAEDISLKAIREQFTWDEDDSNEVIVIQRELIESLNKKMLDKEEEIRKLNIKVSGGSTSIKEEGDVLDG